MTDSMIKLISDLKEGKGEQKIQDLINLGILDMDLLKRCIIEEDDLDLYYRFALNIENSPIDELAEKLLAYPATGENAIKKWDYLEKVFKKSSINLSAKILEAFIVAAQEGGYPKKLLPSLLLEYSKCKNKIDVIIGTKEPIFIAQVLKGSKYRDEQLMNALIQYANNTIDCGGELFMALLNSHEKYTSRLVMCMASLFDEMFLKIFLVPECLEKIKSSLMLESNNSSYLKFLYDFLNMEMENIYYSKYNCTHLKEISYYHDYYFDKSMSGKGLALYEKEFLKLVSASGKSIIEIIEKCPGFIASLNEEEKFQFLMTLYQRRDFKAISTNREAFSPLFQHEKEEITRGM